MARKTEELKARPPLPQGAAISESVPETPPIDEPDEVERDDHVVDELIANIRVTKRRLDEKAAERDAARRAYEATETQVNDLERSMRDLEGRLIVAVRGER